LPELEIDVVVLGKPERIIDVRHIGVIDSGLDDVFELAEGSQLAVIDS
jgi:hypothetical protein